MGCLPPQVRPRRSCSGSGPSRRAATPSWELERTRRSSRRKKAHLLKANIASPSLPRAPTSPKHHRRRLQEQRKHLFRLSLPLLARLLLALFLHHCQPLVIHNDQPALIPSRALLVPALSVVSATLSQLAEDPSRRLTGPILTVNSVSIMALSIRRQSRHAHRLKSWPTSTRSLKAWEWRSRRTAISSIAVFGSREKRAPSILHPPVLSALAVLQVQRLWLLSAWLEARLRMG